MNHKEAMDVVRAVIALATVLKRALSMVIAGIDRDVLPILQKLID